MLIAALVTLLLRPLALFGIEAKLERVYRCTDCGEMVKSAQAALWHRASRHHDPKALELLEEQRQLIEASGSQLVGRF